MEKDTAKEVDHVKAIRMVNNILNDSFAFTYKNSGEMLRIFQALEILKTDNP